MYEQTQVHGAKLIFGLHTIELASEPVLMRANQRNCKIETAMIILLKQSRKQKI